MTTLATYRSSKELFSNLALRELRSKYKRSFLGWAWSTINPLAMMAVYTVVFSKFLRIKIPPGYPSGLHIYALYLLCAMLPWNYFQTSVMGSMGGLVGNANLIKKTYFPRELLPASTVAANLVSHAIEMGLLVVTLVAFGNYYAAEYLPLTAVLMLTMAIFALGLGLFLSVLNVYFRDIEHFMAIFFLIWLYLTPIIYPITLVPHRLLFFMKLNPMTDATLCFRSVLYDGTLPHWPEFAYFLGASIVMFIIGLAVFIKLEPKLAEEL